MEAYFENARNQIKLQTSYAFIQAGAQLAKEGFGFLTNLASNKSNKDKGKETKDSEKEKEAKELLAKNDAKEAEKKKDVNETQKATG
jgi:hypothetical protein